MNFFAHYYFHHQPGNTWHNAGLLFPDLLRIFTKDQRISEKNEIELNDAQQDYLSLVKGIKQHFKADDIFHNWNWFKEKNHDLALQIRESNSGIKRDWFLAHILIELAIDHVLVTENESKVKDLYNDLIACDKQQWKIFFNKNGLSDLDNWYDGFNQFNKHQYIFTYKDTDNVVYALNRIYERTGIGKFTSPQNKFLVVLLNNFIPEVRSKLKELRNILE